MSTLSWNCRGLGNPRIVREVVDLVSRKKPEFVFLMETKVNREHAERLRVKIGFEGLFYVDSIGRSGGLALFWRRNNTAKLLSFSTNHVDVEVCVTGLGTWIMTGFYGFPERSRRNAAWDLLRTLAGRSTLPWVVLGDFNDLLFQHEKRGGKTHLDGLLRGFGETLDDCGLIQLPMQGHQFTWGRGKGTQEWMEERLDKVLARADWCDSLPAASVSNILTRNSDHSALFLGVKERGVSTFDTHRQFRFEMAWIHDEGCRQQVEVTWQEGRGDGLMDCLQYCGMKLQCWGGDHFHKFGDKIRRLKKEQAQLHGRLDSDSLSKYQELEAELYASARKKKNTLTRLKNDSGLWVEDDELNTLVLNYFSEIFTSSSSVSAMDSFAASVEPRVTQDQNEVLLRPFQPEEVKTALFSMFPDKAPGPDGMNPGFYQHYWDVVGGDVTTFVLNCLNSCSFSNGLNNTNVVLIPKKNHPELVSD
ncbi:uncharacterized protein LOC116033272 [Ipomoea triloba]|uniref:uncharacterized protein LOC116033272 n=1 Tax=Ipomoea triloba TaxID=35885 RepID=UPI00125DAF2D|nr:uncharacterized protein LOC116033272 [Ipomoea triloba]